MGYKIRYVGSAGEVNFSSLPFLFEDNDLFRYEWSFTQSDAPQGNGSRLSNFHFPSAERSLKFYCVSEDVFTQINTLDELFNADVMNETPGKLYVDDVYCPCYIVSMTPDAIKKPEAKQAITLKIRVLNPTWIKEETFSFSASDQRTITGLFKLPISFPFSWSKSLASSYITNGYFKPARAVITIYGPASSPSFSIDNHMYKINGDLLDHERFVIDQIEKTVVKITTTGSYVNAFAMREKSSSVFEPIPVGRFAVQYYSNFSLQIVLKHERTMPIW